MYRVKKLLLVPGFILSGCLLLLLRYILRTPQPLISPLPGDDSIYKWTHGQVFYKVYGNSNASALLLLHAPGIGASAHELLPLIEHLSSRYCIYAPDLLGFGLSDAPDIDYNADLFVTLCQDFLQDVVQRPATLLASGLSCNYASAVASRSPELCTNLVLLAPNYTREIGSAYSMNQPSRKMGVLSSNTLFGTFLYALLTPSIILRQIIRLQNAGRPGVSNDLTYYFAVAHQLGAQYAALAFVGGKLNLDITHENPLQPTLLIWSGTPPINVATQHYIGLSQVEALNFNTEPHSLAVSEAQDVANAILHWQNTTHKELPVGASIASLSRENEALASVHSFPPIAVTESDSVTADVVESSQPSELNFETKSEGSLSSSPETIEAYCVKCKQKRTMKNAKQIVTKNGRNAMEGICPVCSTKLFRFISSQNSTK